MKQTLPLLAVLLLAALTVRSGAEPVVVGFDRFHAAKPTAEGGRLLFNELGCVNCHGGETAMPARRGPDLLGVAQRESAEWLRKFLADPAAAHEGTAMPRLLQKDEVEPVLNYLATLKPKTAGKAKALRHVNTALGK
jgi:cytochrome c2